MEIEFYENNKGRQPAKEFLISLSDKDRAKMVTVIEQLAEKGNELRRPYSAALRDNILELRVKGEAIMSKDFQDFLQEQLKNPDFAKEYYAIKPEVEFSIILHDARKKLGITQKNLADQCGIKQENISRIENGDRLPSINTVQKIANALGLQLALVPKDK